jgi:hypothetical protein
MRLIERGGGGASVEMQFLRVRRPNKAFERTGYLPPLKADVRPSIDSIWLLWLK